MKDGDPPNGIDVHYLDEGGGRATRQGVLARGWDRRSKSRLSRGWELFRGWQLSLGVYNYNEFNSLPEGSISRKDHPNKIEAVLFAKVVRSSKVE